jgi:hypothetical protein
MFGGGQVHAYGVRVPEVPFDKPGLPREQAKPVAPPPGFPPPGTEGYPHMLQAVCNLYDWVVKASGNVPPAPMQYGGHYTPPPGYQQGQWGDGKVLGAPVGGYPQGGGQYFNNANWGWNGGPPGPSV